PSRPSAWRLPSTRVRPRTRYGTGYGDVRTTLPSRGAERPRVASALEAREGGAAGVDRGVVEDLLDAQQLVVLGDALGAGRGAGLDLAAVGGDGEVGDGDVLGLAGAVGHHALVAVALGQLDRVQGLGERADLVDLHQQGVGGALLDAAGQTLGVGDEQVVTDELDLVAELGGDGLPALP